MAVLYRHLRADTGSPFYIGIGQDEKRAYSKKGRTNYWKRIVQKHGYKVQIMLDDLTWEQAQKKEREFIQLYGRVDLGLGTLVNLTDGGEGALGVIRSEETKAKISATLTGRVFSEEWRAKIGAAMKGKTLGKQSEEHVAKVSAALKGKPNPKVAAALKAYWAKKKNANNLI